MVVPNAAVRVDKWLWATRFFKTRALAREAILGGKVRLDGNRVKPGRTLKIGDKLNISRAEEQFEVVVMIVSDRRVSATLASEMYSEDPASVLRREAAAEQRKQDRAGQVQTQGRPDKRERRRIVNFTRDRS